LGGTKICRGELFPNAPVATGLSIATLGKLYHASSFEVNQSCNAFSEGVMFLCVAENKFEELS